MALQDERDQADLQQAVEILEYPTFADQVSKTIGKPLEFAINALPNRVTTKLGKLTNACIKQAYKVVLMTVDSEKSFKKSRNGVHKTAVTLTGATGGFLGGLGMAVELPISTGIMMRSIADIARSEGEDLATPESRLACLQVLALDTTNHKGAPADAGAYFYIRSTMATAVRDAVAFIAANGLVEEGAPALIRVMSAISERFGIQLTEKIASEIIPVVGAVTGGGMNFLFMSHFQRIARGHFIIRRLEREYGSERIQGEYNAVLRAIERERNGRKLVRHAAIDIEPIANEQVFT